MYREIREEARGECTERSGRRLGVSVQRVIREEARGECTES